MKHAYINIEIMHGHGLNLCLNVDAYGSNISISLAS